MRAPSSAVQVLETWRQRPGRRTFSEVSSRERIPRRSGQRHALSGSLLPRGSRSRVRAQALTASFQASPLSTSGSRGKPRMRSPTMLRRISDVPPSIVLARARRNACARFSALLSPGSQAWPRRARERHGVARPSLVQLGVQDLVDRTLGTGLVALRTRRRRAERVDLLHRLLGVELRELLTDLRVACDREPPRGTSATSPCARRR